MDPLPCDAEATRNVASREQLVAVISPIDGHLCLGDLAICAGAIERALERAKRLGQRRRVIVRVNRGQDRQRVRSEGKPIA